MSRSQDRRDETVLEFRGVAAGYGGVPVFSRMDLKLSLGEGVCFIGKNGSGKSTVLRCIVRQAEVLHGTIRLLGRSPSEMPAHTLAELGLAYVPQNRGDLPSLTVEENLRLAALNQRGAKTAEVVERAFEVAPPLRPLRASRVGGLSGGERTLVAFARALSVQSPLRILLVDEVSAGLSQSNRLLVRQQFSRLREEGTALVMAEQNLEFAREVGLPLRFVNRGESMDSEAPAGTQGFPESAGGTVPQESGGTH